MSFADLHIRRHYDSDEADVLAEFYKPVLSTARRYDRAVGYFSSSAFRACAKELSAFVGNAGAIRLVVGCLVAQADIDALCGTGVEPSQAERLLLRDELRDQLAAFAEVDIDAAMLLAKLIVSGVAELKFAIRTEGIYHEKFGVFEDEIGLKVAFIGSANETEAALSFGANHESFSVYQSIEPSIYSAYGTDLEDRFENLWLGKTRKTRICDLDADSLALMHELASRTISHSAPPEFTVLPKIESRFELREYQHDAIKAWAAHNYRGILAMATGTGKTLTAIDAVKRFKDRVPGGAVVITVPYQNLALQWMDALRDQGQEVVPVFSSYLGWYLQVKNIFLAAQISDATKMPCLVCVNDTFKDGRFQELLDLLADAKQDHHFLIVDECHHFNGPDHIRSLPEHFTFRLGLSATPYDQYAQRYLDAYFGGIVYEFSLGRAIKEGFLTPYQYHVIPVYLDAEETDVYEEITRKIVQIAGSDDGFTPETLAKVQPLLLRRARVVGAARDKLIQLEHHLRSTGRTPYTLFYCGDGSLEEDGTRQRQIELVSQLLHKLGWRTSRITAEESLKEREALLDNLRRHSIDAVVSIKVLDEGIDIPACRSAYLLASQSSDRQGIQRRGRVLRRSEGKELADLYDFVVLGGATSSKSMRGLATKELKRAWQFASDAGNCATLLPGLIQTASSIGVTVGESNDER